MTYIKSIVAATAVAACASAVDAGTGSEGYFQIYNDSGSNVLVGFYTNDGSGWSANWIGGAEIMPGENGRATFNAETGSCDQVFQAGWLGSDGSEVFDEPSSIDICDASNVYLGDNEVSYD